MLGGLGITELLICVPILVIGLIVLIVFLSQRNKRKEVQSGTKKCVYCAEYIKVDAKVCRNCGREVPE